MLKLPGVSEWWNNMKLARERALEGEDYLDVYDRLALAAYCRPPLRDPARADDTLEDGSPPASNGVWNQTGKPRQRVSAAT